jgi:hypothetical protein
MRIDIPADFTVEQLLGLIQEQPEKLDGFYSTREWAKFWGFGVHRTCRIIERAIELGMVERSVIYRENISGISCPRTVFKITLPKES